jgi:DNA/RNA-binding domain of Phe-tRNA-synthetase-like protein
MESADEERSSVTSPDGDASIDRSCSSHAAAETSLRVDPEMWKLFHGMQIVVVTVQGLTVSDAVAAHISKRWHELWNATSTTHEVSNAQSHPRVQPWRKHMSALGVSGQKYPSSIEALLRRALKGAPPPDINPLVDLYNYMSLKHMVPVGGFDAQVLKGTLDLRVSRQGDRFVPLNNDELEHLPSGEICYSVGDEVLTRHFVWRQSRVGLIGPETTNAILVAEVLGDVVHEGPQLPEKILVELEEELAPIAENVTSTVLSRY